MLYINGILEASGTNNVINSGINNDLFIGGDPFQVVQNPNAAFNGKIDDLGFWNRVLTQAEITSLQTSSYGNVGIGITNPQRKYTLTI